MNGSFREAYAPRIQTVGERLWQTCLRAQSRGREWPYVGWLHSSVFTDQHKSSKAELVGKLTTPWKSMKTRKRGAVKKKIKPDKSYNIRIKAPSREVFEELKVYSMGEVAFCFISVMFQVTVGCKTHSKS